MQNYRDIIKGPIMTEKSNDLKANNIVTLSVDPKANKTQIKQAVEKVFKVKVESVNTVTVRPRKKRVGKYTGYTNKVKKAIVKLKDGSSINKEETMAVKTYKAMTNGTRGMSKLVNDEITKTTPEKSLTITLTKKGGRNNQGKITVRHRGGGAKRKYRIIDFKRNKDNVIGTVASIEYDPNRTANIALINYADGEKRYIIAPKGLKVGMQIESGENEFQKEQWYIMLN